ncbi:hypothetical protein Sste5346_005514 [Sporothrix stenoceras]|uniref:2EXR domain-containing protein n=1 Tax=Sporothrix stenoceras TaxID=5173 RepID=A0ABR3Z4D0_9PEZI
MAHDNNPIAADTSLHANTPLAFRRADGSRREFFFDDRTHSLPHPAASLFLEEGSSTHGGSGEHGSYRQRRPGSAQHPRNVLRPFRNRHGEPAADIRFIRETRQSVCRDGVDRSRCSECRRAVTSTTKTEVKTTTKAKGKSAAIAEISPNTVPTTTTPAVASATPEPEPAHRWHMMSPQRVFRDLVMSDVAEPLQPNLRDALLDAFNATVDLQQLQTRKVQSDTPPKTPFNLGRPLLPSPPPSPTKAVASESPIDEEGTVETTAPTEFHYFSCLPYEIRRMIWEQALPFRVLLREDLQSTTYKSVRRVFRPASHTRSIEMLWQSDLFYVCTEARRVVEAAYGGPKHNSPPTVIMSDDGPQPPLVRQITSPARLRSGRDVLYYPWLGAEAIREHSSAGFSGGGLWVLGRHHDQQQQQQSPYYHGHSSAANNCSWMFKYDGSAPRNRTSPPPLTAPAPITSVPYAHWASQLRLLRLPVSTVALDAAWIDRSHMDTITWAAGVDLSQDDDTQDEGNGEEPVAAPVSLQVVVADLIIPVKIRLDLQSGITLAQRRLLQQHIAPQPWLDARSFQRLLVEGRGRPASSSSSSSSSQQGPIEAPSANLNGMDFTVLVDLYDDWRIEELLSLQTINMDEDSVLNKAACHRCIACTRREWEARSTENRSRTGGNSWTNKFGPVVGQLLQNLCRPTIVFSVVLSFVDKEQ